VLRAAITFNHVVECIVPLDLVFQSLADATRRDILRRLSRAEETISALAAPYKVSLAAIAKHVSVLERAGLVVKKRTGKEKVVRLVPATLKAAENHLSEYEKLWAARYDALEALLANNPQPEEKQKWPPSKSKSRKTPRT
jgi:DNA-binding transcriptional ArsR family regulator